MRKDIKLIALTILGSFIVVFSLYGFSVKEILFEKNGFARVLKVDEKELIDKIPIEMKISEIIEVSESELFFLDEKRTDIFKLDLASHEITALNFDVLVQKLGLPGIHQASVDCGKVIITSPRNRQLYITDLNSQQEKIVDSIAIPFGADKIGVTPTNILVKGRDSLFNSRFYSINKDNKEEKTISGPLMTNDREGIILDDGLFSHSESYTVYAKYHKNEFYVFKNGEAPLRWSTLTNTPPTLQINTSENGTVTIMGEIKYVNGRAAIDEKNLYLQSGIKSDNESSFRFKFSSIVDVYELEDKGSYLHSFYIPSYSGVKMNSFKVFNDKIFAAHGNYLLIYNL